MSEKKIMLGDTPIEDVAAALKVVSDALIWIAENVETTDEETMDNIRAGFVILAIDEMTTRPIRNMVARKLAEDIRRKEAEKEKLQTIPIAAFRATEKS